MHLQYPLRKILPAPSLCTLQIASASTLTFLFYFRIIVYLVKIPVTLVRLLPQPLSLLPPLIVSTCFWCHHLCFVSSGPGFKGTLSQIHHCFNCSWDIGKQTQATVGGFHCQRKNVFSEVILLVRNIRPPWCSHPKSTI